MSWLKFFLTLHLAALEILRKKKRLGLHLHDTALSPLAWCLGAALLFTAKKLLKSR